MKVSEKEVVTRILSFNYSQLSDWIKERLHGNDKYFPVYLRHEPDHSEFLVDVFHNIEDETFRGNFLDILADLTSRLCGLTASECEEYRDYISGLLTLCGNIRRFNNRDTLMEIAVSGKFKGIKIDEGHDLHADLLTTLASYGIPGNFDFWIEQMRDPSCERYANPAFYMLKNNLDILFKHIGIFIDKFGGEVELVLGIASLLDEYGRKEILKRFKEIQSSLSGKQKRDVNHAFIEAGYTAPYNKRRTRMDISSVVYGPLAAGASMVGEGTTKKVPHPLARRAADVFQAMGFHIDFNYQVAGLPISMFIKRKKAFTDKYECYVCEFGEGDRKVGKNAVRDLSELRDAVREQLKKEKSPCVGCEALFISIKGFTPGAVLLAEENDILLKTIDELIDEIKK